MKTNVITKKYQTSRGNEIVLRFPSHFAVCDRCRGHGTHVNPNVDGNGLTAEDFDEDPDFRENYFSGMYDVTCERCHGRRVVAEIDEGACSKRQLAKLALIEQQEADDRADWESERWLRAAEAGR